MGVPDPILGMTKDEAEGRVTAFGKSFMVLDGERFFVRVLLPVQLDVPHEFRFGVWLEISREAYQSIWDIWDAPAYAKASVDGRLANAVPPWGETVLGAECTAIARNQTDALFIHSSRQAALSTVLSTPWSVHECEELIRTVWEPSTDPARP